MSTFRKGILALCGSVFATASMLACVAVAEGQGASNTLTSYSPSLVKASGAYGPLFSHDMPRSSDEPVAAGDFVEHIRAPDGSDIRILVKAPAPSQPGKILKMPTIAPGQTANAYFDGAIHQAISGGYAQLVFPHGVYNFVAPPSKQSHWTISGAHDLTIDGQGSSLNFASPLTAGVTIRNSQRIVFKGFDIDWPNELMASVATISAIDPKRNTMDIKIAPQYHVNAQTPIIALTPWDAKTDPGNPHMSLTAFYKEEYTNNTHTKFLGNNTFEVPYWNHYIQVGDVMLVRHWGWSPWRSALETGGSYNIDFEHVHIYASPYLAFVLSGGGGYRLSHCSVTRRNPGRLISSSADAVHIAENTGDIIIEDSIFGYQGDDGTNIHGAMGMVDQENDHALHWKAGGEGAYAPYSWAAGKDVIGFFGNTLGFLGTSIFQSLSHPKAGLTINVDGTIPKGTAQIVDLSRSSARFVIRNNQYLYNRARGLLLESSLGLVENNTFIGQTLHGVVVGVWPGGEGPGVQNVVFRGNRFENTGSFAPIPVPNQDARLGALVVGVQGDAANQASLIPAHANLVFDGNIFHNLQGPGLFISRANAVAVVNNQFTNTNLSPIGPSTLGSASLDGSIVVTHAHNVYLSKNSMEHAGPVSIDGTSTNGIEH
jgi:hypothetical protein